MKKAKSQNLSDLSLFRNQDGTYSIIERFKYLTAVIMIAVGVTAILRAIDLP